MTTIDCKHWTDCGILNGGCCAIDHYDMPPHRYCQSICEFGPKKADTLKRPKPRGLCRHLGGELERITCEGCSGTVKVRIYACEIYGRAQIGSGLEMVNSCATCNDHMER